MHFKMPFGKWRSLCLGLNVLIDIFKTVLYKHLAHLPTEHVLAKVLNVTTMSMAVINVYAV